ncbi:DesA-family fatty acid desaturase [Chroococcus sp. FPU101]|nr:DesA-family fatty acid desaturase [Chroococcus sp. FPU101]
MYNNISMKSQVAEININQFPEDREWIKDLLTPQKAIFWSDLLLSASVGWMAFIIAYLVTPLSWQQGIAVIIAAIAFYRALVFIHELTHLKENAIPKFKLCWNLLVGIPLLLPSFTYTGVHADHHRLSTYGTEQDPEYRPFAGKKGEILFFVAHSFLLPGLLTLRFLVLAPIGLFIPSLHHLLERHASSLSMNLAYCRKVNDVERSEIKITEIILLSIWSIPISLAALGILSWRIFVIWYVMMALIMCTNTLRTLGAHRYGSDGTSMNLEQQLQDSVDTPGEFWTVLWAPVGLRYHALHHYFPSMPYHNLPVAYQRLSQNFSPQTTSSSLWSSLKQLWNEQPRGQIK